MNSENTLNSLSVSQKTTVKVQQRARELNISWPLDEALTDEVLDKKLFPKDSTATEKRMPDFEYIRKELLKHGVSKKLLWVEYCEDCRIAGDSPLMYSQFCYYIQQDEEKRRATMHTPENPVNRLKSIGQVTQLTS